MATIGKSVKDRLRSIFGRCKLVGICLCNDQYKVAILGQNMSKLPKMGENDRFARAIVPQRLTQFVLTKYGS
jgi:hypothetical protein